MSSEIYQKTVKRDKLILQGLVDLAEQKASVGLVDPDLATEIEQLSKEAAEWHNCTIEKLHYNLMVEAAEEEAVQEEDDAGLMHSLPKLYTHNTHARTRHFHITTTNARQFSNRRGPGRPRRDRRGLSQACRTECF